MEKYRIIETSTPIMSEKSTSLEVDYLKTYHIEECVFHIFGYFKIWHKVKFKDTTLKIRSIFRSVEEAKSWMKFGEEETKRTVVYKL